MDMTLSGATAECTQTTGLAPPAPASASVPATASAAELGESAADLDAELWVAAQHGHLASVRSVLSRLRSEGSPYEAVLAAALEVAACNDHVETVRVLIEARADVNPSYRPALWAAISRGCVASAAVLLQAKAWAVSSVFTCALECAAMYGFVDTARLLLPVTRLDCFPDVALRTAAKFGHADVCELLCEAKADVNNVTSDVFEGRRESRLKTCLRYAVDRQHESTVLALLKCKACINTCMPLQAAVDRGYIGMARLLLKNRADVHDRNPPHHAPLLASAVLRRDLRMTRLLLAAKASANTPVRVQRAGVPSNGTVLHPAAHFGDVAMMRLLVQCKANLNARTDTGDTAMAFATAHGNVAAMQLLESFGVER
jgi:ankyrin